MSTECNYNYYNDGQVVVFTYSHLEGPPIHLAKRFRDQAISLVSLKSYIVFLRTADRSCTTFRYQYELEYAVVDFLGKTRCSA